MNPELARKTIGDTFRQAFDEGRFLYFVRNLLNHLDESKKQVWTLKKAAFEDYVNHFTRLGTYTDPRGERMDVLIVHLRRETTLARGRVTLRNFVADYLATGHGQGKAAVIVAFVSPNEDDWRFSFVKLDYTFEKTDIGFVTERAQLTPARRYSYLVGKNENCHTAQKQFVELLETDTADPTVDQLEAAFSIEKVTKEFYEHYKDLFEKTRDGLADFLDSAPAIKQHFTDRGIENDDFAKKLLGQIVFLYFLQKKGWFGVERGKTWGSGRRDFIRHLFTNRKDYAHIVGQRGRPANFFNDILEPLFYEALAAPRVDEDHYYSRFDCRIPFLNGGLFEPLYGYKWVETDILLPDALFSNEEEFGEGEKGTGILDVFDRYNFTVNESEPLEKEVAVDPEMLGKVFENLLPENIRHSSGTYYTPRVIVHNMCQQALLHYLTAHATQIPQNDLTLFLRLAERFTDFEAKDTKSYAERGLLLPESIRQNAALLDDLLATITVCDPAIGSGAFPVGMMHEIVRARLALTRPLDKKGDSRAKKPRSAYALKRDAIQHSLYGVDLDPGAVEIAKLRLWLSMVVDEEEISQIQPLPNLDYKIMQGNSLLEEFDGIRLLDEKFLQPPNAAGESEITDLKARIASKSQEFVRLHGEGRKSAAAKLNAEQEIKRLKKRLDALVNPAEAKTSPQGELTQQTSWANLKRIQELHSKYFDENSRTEKEKLRKELDTLEWSFMEATLREQGREQAIAELKKASAKHRKPFFLWRLHYGEVFLQQGGFDVVIANPPFVVVQGENRDERLYERFKKLYEVAAYKIDLYHLFIERGVQLLRDHGAICYITPSNFVSNNYAVRLRNFLLTKTVLDRLVFFDERVFEASVHNLVFAARKGNPKGNQTAFCKAAISETGEFTLTEVYKLNQSSLVTKQSFLILRENTAAEALLTQMDGKNRHLTDFADVVFGMQLRDRSKFPEDVVENPPNPKGLSKFHKRCYTGKDISRYQVRWQNRYCYFNREAKRGGCWDETMHFAKNKILLRQIGSHPEGGIDLEGHPVLNTAFMVVPKAEELSSAYLLAIINSSAIRFYWTNRFGDDRKTFPKIKGEYLKLLPIPFGLQTQRSIIEGLVEYLLSLHREALTNGELAEGTGARLLAGYFEQWVNALVYELFFPEPLHAAGLQFFLLAEQARLRPLSAMKGNELVELRAKFEELYSPKHPLRQGLFALDSIKEIRIIEGKP
jgi:hypothetical protein